MPATFRQQPGSAEGRRRVAATGQGRARAPGLGERPSRGPFLSGGPGLGYGGSVSYGGSARGALAVAVPPFGRGIRFGGGSPWGLWLGDPLGVFLEEDGGAGLGGLLCSPLAGGALGALVCVCGGGIFLSFGGQCLGGQ